MLERGRGVILNAASVASSLKGVPSRFIYSVTKAAVIGMTKSVAADYCNETGDCHEVVPILHCCRSCAACCLLRTASGLLAASNCVYDIVFA